MLGNASLPTDILHTNPTVLHPSPNPYTQMPNASFSDSCEVEKKKKILPCLLSTLQQNHITLPLAIMLVHKINGTQNLVPGYCVPGTFIRASHIPFRVNTIIHIF